MSLNNVAGGWTVDQGYIDVINDNGLDLSLFRAAIITAIKAKLIAIEIAGTLSPAEKCLRDSGDYSIDRVIGFIKTEIKYISRGQNSPYADVVTMINNQWANILKRWT